MKIEALETFLHDGQRYEAGDSRTVDDVLGAYFCQCGWAKDLDGGVETAPRDVNRVVTLDVHSAATNETARIK